MSRTFKDVPQRVIEARNYKAGRIDHDHRAPRVHDRISYWADRELSVTFYKRDTKAINAYRAHLDSLGDEIEYTVEERPGAYTMARFGLDGAYEPPVYGPKTVAFVVHRRVRYHETAYCTDVEHYDPVTNTDTRDGGRVKCTPAYEDPARPGYRRYRCSCCDGKARPKRATVKQALGQLAREANGFGLDPDFSDELFEEANGPKSWGYFC